MSCYSNYKKWFVVVCCCIAMVIGLLVLLKLFKEPEIKEVMSNIAIIITLCTCIINIINEWIKQKQQ